MKNKNNSDKDALFIYVLIQELSGQLQRQRNHKNTGTKFQGKNIFITEEIITTIIIITITIIIIIIIIIINTVTNMYQNQ
jgi:hypothetical protein